MFRHYFPPRRKFDTIVICHVLLHIIRAPARKQCAVIPVAHGATGKQPCNCYSSSPFVRGMFLYTCLPGSSVLRVC